MPLPVSNLVVAATVVGGSVTTTGIWGASS